MDAFLYNFTILPLKAIFASVMMLWDATRLRRLRYVTPGFEMFPGDFANLRYHVFFRVPPSISLSPILRSLLVIIPTIVLSMTTDVSKMYHKVRGQDTIKLYVIYNALEVSPFLALAMFSANRPGTDRGQALLGFWPRYPRHLVLQGDARGSMVE